jgi:hypothetical protein
MNGARHAVADQFLSWRAPLSGCLEQGIEIDPETAASTADAAAPLAARGTRFVSTGQLGCVIRPLDRQSRCTGSGCPRAEGDVRMPV